MAEATRAIADLCDEPGMRAKYLALAEAWERRAGEDPGPLPEESSSQVH
jgi:hypothetical protein